jgi:anti-anti-sigma factor
MAMADRFVHSSEGNVELVELQLPQQMDFNEFDKIIEGLTEIVSARPAARWIIDCSAVAYTGSAALGLLVNMRQQIKETGGALVLCGISPRLSDILHACSLDRLFKTASSRAAAMKAV